MAMWSLAGKKILLIDDYGEMRSMLRKMLSGYGAEDINSTATGEEAIELIGHNRFDIILCDYNLGDGKDGQQVLEEVKHRGYITYSTVFIMITAESTAFMVMGALEYQPDEYLSKPVTATVLQARLQKLLEKKEKFQALSKALENRDHAKAIEQCDEQLTHHPRYRFELLKLKCEQLIELQQFDAVRELCQQVLADRDIPWANMALGKIHFYNNEYEAAQTIFKQVIAHNESYVAAYDWLSRTHLQLDDHRASQKVLQQAVEWSPKSVQRQRALAEASERNNDYHSAEEARKKVVRVGKNSVLRQASDYASLAKVLVKNNNSKEAFRFIDMIKREFKGDTEAALTAALTKEKIYRDSGDKKRAADAAQEALTLFSELPAISSSDLAIELTSACLAHGKIDEAGQVVQQLVNNNHDDDQILQQISDTYKESGQEQTATLLLTQLRKEMVATNNQGVKLLNSGQVEESIGFFEKALGDAPNNPALNINTAQAYLTLLKKGGNNADRLQKTRNCLDLAHSEPKLHDRYQVLNKLYWEIANR